MVQTCHHGHRHTWCALCIRKVRWPKGYKPCRCHVLIPKDWDKCPKCIAFTELDFHSSRPAERLVDHKVCRKVNHVVS